MKKNYKRYLVALLILTVHLVMFAPAAQAAEVSIAGIPVTVSLSGGIPEIDEDYEIVLKADDLAYPMPSGSIDGVYRLIVTGANTAALPGIQYSALGIYTYTITQTAGTNEFGNYDDSIYHMTVYITNAEDGSGFESTVIVNKADETEKLDEIAFHNDYEIEIIDEEPPGGDVEPTDPPDKDKDNTPKTGDDILIWPFIVMFIGAGALLLILALTRKKKKASTTSQLKN
jgi:pilin isopeptide linkage protein/LPXTG-motif cell wall-anchored protein